MLDNITGEMRIYAKEVEVKKGKQRTTRLIFNGCVGASKDEDGNYLNYYMPVNFSNEVKKKLPKSLGDGDCVDCVIKEAWIKAYKDKDDYTRPIFFINKAKVVVVSDEDEEDDEEEVKPKKSTSNKPASKSKKPAKEVDDDSLPY